MCARKFGGIPLIESWIIMHVWIGNRPVCYTLIRISILVVGIADMHAMIYRLTTGQSMQTWSVAKWKIASQITARVTPPLDGHLRS